MKRQIKLFLLSFTMLLLVACGPGDLREIEKAAQADKAAEIVVGSEDETTENSEVDEEAVVNTDEAAPIVAESEPGVAGYPVEDLVVDGADSAETAPTNTTITDTEKAVVEKSETLYKGVPVGFTEDGHAYMGNLDAPVVIEEYSDFQCPFCARFYQQTMVNMVESEIQNGDALLIFYDFPLNFHPQAPAAANAARCAGEQSAVAYWDMHDVLFDTLGDWALNDPSAKFIGYAEQIGNLDIDVFSECVISNKYQAEVQADLALGQTKGVRGTPAFFINGELLSGAQPYNVFVTAIAKSKEGESITSAPDPSEIEVDVPQKVTLSEEYAVTFGDPDAPVKIVEYTDYQCPFCGRHSAETLPTLLETYVAEGRVFYAIKDLPIDQIHPKARIASVAARCAGEQDAYLEMHDKLFATGQQWGQSADEKELFLSYSAELGLDTDAFDTCLNSDKYDAAIEASVQEAAAAGISGTPFFVVDDYPVISGAQPLAAFEQVIGLVEEGELVNAIMDSQRRQIAQQQAQAQQQPEPTKQAAPVDVPLGDAYTIGDPDAPVVIVEYTDYQCPFCSRHFTQTFNQIKENYVDTGIVRYVFKDFPLDFHAQAGVASEAARCAGDQDAFLEMHTRLFDNQTQWGNAGAVDIFNGYATEMGLDTAAFAECLDTQKYAEAVQADLAEGAGLGVRGTPAFFVNGMFVNGAQPYNVFQNAIDTAAAAQQ